jgi:hypothetical protein
VSEAAALVMIDKLSSLHRTCDLEDQDFLILLKLIINEVEFAQL